MAMSTAAPSEPAASPPRVTVVPLMAQSLLPASYGVLLPLPPSHSSLLSSVAAALCLPAGWERRLSLFVDEGADHWDDGDRRCDTETSLWSGRRGGELTERSFPLLRDNDVLHALLPAAHNKPKQHGFEAAGKMAQASGDSSGPAARQRRIELRVVDRSSGGSLRFQINPRRRLSQLMGRFEQHAGWQQGALRLMCARRIETQHGEAVEQQEEAELSGQETL